MAESRSEHPIDRRRVMLLGAGLGIQWFAGCGGGGASASNGATPVVGSPTPPLSGTPSPEAPPPVPPPDLRPHRLVIEDHTAGQSQVDVGALTLDRRLQVDAFAHPKLRAESAGWVEFGRSGAAIVFDGIEFDAWLFEMNSGGIYSSQERSFRVLLLMRSMDLNGGVFGDPRGKRTYPRAFKLRLENATAYVLGTVQMRDGLAINAETLVQDPQVIAREDTEAKTKVLRRHVCVGTAIPIFLGPEPVTSASAMGHVPRAKTGALGMPNFLGKTRSVVNGDEMLIFSSSNTGGNGNAHPYVMPRWALSKSAMESLGTTLPTNDPDLAVGNYPRIWESALSYGWDYEPGNFGGITNRAGPGGQRGDRTTLPPEFVQMYLTEPGGARLHDGAAHVDMMRAFFRNCWNYPAYRHAGGASLSPIDAITVPFKAPASDGGNPGSRPQLVASYYNRGNSTLESPTLTPNAIWSLDSYGQSSPDLYRANLNPLDGRHPTGGWNPDGEHNVRLFGTWGSWIFADPIYSKMQEFLFAENAMDSPAQDESINNDSYYPFGFKYSTTEEFPQLSRTNVLKLSHWAGMWAAATDGGTFSQQLCESRLRAMARHFHNEYIVVMPSDDGSPNRLGWHNFRAPIVFDPNMGWCLVFPISSQYIAEFLVVSQSFGLLSKLRNEGSEEDRIACSYLIDSFIEHCRNFERWMAYRPWFAYSDTDYGQLMLPLRTPAQGAVQSDVTTIPKSWSEILSYPAPTARSDGFWFLNQDGVRVARSNYMLEARMKIAFVTADLFPDADSPARLTELRARLMKLINYPTLSGQPSETIAANIGYPCLRHLWPHSVPALGV